MFLCEIYGDAPWFAGVGNGLAISDEGCSEVWLCHGPVVVKAYKVYVREIVALLDCKSKICVW